MSNNNNEYSLLEFKENNSVFSLIENSFFFCLLSGTREKSWIINCGFKMGPKNRTKMIFKHFIRTIFLQWVGEPIFSKENTTHYTLIDYLFITYNTMYIFYNEMKNFEYIKYNLQWKFRVIYQIHEVKHMFPIAERVVSSCIPKIQ